MKTRLGILLGCVWVAVTLSAGNEELRISLTDGSVEAVSLESIQKIVFDGSGGMVIQLTDESRRFDLAALQNMVFASTGTGLKPEPAVTPSNQLRVIVNPVQDVLRLRFTTEGTEEVLIQVFDRSGRLLMGRLLAPGQCQDEVQLPVSDLPDGLYLCRVVCNKRVQVAKFVK